jgi:hypothetical protein
MYRRRLRLGALAAAPPPRAVGARSSPLVAKVTAGLLAGAGAIHLALTPEHFREQVLYGVFFLGAAIVQLALAGVLVLRPTRWAFRLGVLSSGGLIATWLVTRALAPPFSASPERVTFAGVVASSVELAALLLLAVALPVDAATAERNPRFAWRWALAAGPAFALLFLFATGSLAWVETDLSKNVAVPSLLVDTADGWTFRSPWLTVVLGDHLLLGLSWVVAAFLVAAGVLVALNTGLTVGLARSARACRPQAGGVVAVAPAFLAAPTCCGAGLPIGFALGGGTALSVLAATPWLLLATTALLVGNLLLLLRRWRGSEP